MQFTILVHIIHLLFPFLIWAHVYVNAIFLLLTWAHNCVYTFVLVFCLFFVDQMQRNGQMDLDFRTFPMQIWSQRATRHWAFRMLKLEDEHWKDHILNSLLSILWFVNRTFWCVFSCARSSNLSLIEEPLPWASKRERSKSHWGTFQEQNWLLICLNLQLLCLLIPKDGSYLDHQYDLKRGTPLWFCFFSLTFLHCLGF